MSEKNPSIFSHTKIRMAKAIFEVMPKIFHELCNFDLMQNALKHLGYLYKSGSKFGDDFKACIFGYENEH